MSLQSRFQFAADNLSIMDNAVRPTFLPFKKQSDRVFKDSWAITVATEVESLKNMGRIFFSPVILLAKTGHEALNFGQNFLKGPTND